ncbi:MAG: enoyl-CoA hydratase/isomerase family protein [Candidatus Poribacteria bacterium]
MVYTPSTRPYYDADSHIMELPDFLQRYADPDVRAILLRSQGRVFCAGADLVNANPVADPLPPGSRSPFYVAAARLYGVQTPVVAAVQGAAVGAGLGLALVADFRIGSPQARFVANFVQLGLHPGFGISAVLERVIGRQRAAMMLMTGRRIRGEEAERWGLVDQLVSAEELDAVAMALAQEISAAAPLAVASTRRTLRRGWRRARGVKRVRTAA